MKVGLIDADGHGFPNLALMRISAFHKAQGDTVGWWDGWEHYQRVYKSKVFSEAYSEDDYDPVNCDELIKGGTGYCISTINGREIYDREKDKVLPAEIESAKPDYSIYPQFDFAIAMTSRGCPRGCPWCHVAAKEGKASVKVADVDDFYDGQKSIEVLDPNLLACRNRIELLEQYAETGAEINYNQGLDIRLVTEQVAEILMRTRIKNLHFAWDNPKDDLVKAFRLWADIRGGKPSDHGVRNGTVYVLTNFDFTMEETLYRIYTLRDMGYAPYVMVYDKPHAPKEIRQLQRWCNNRFVFYKTPRFEDYKRK